MAESGCLDDMNVENLNVNGIILGAKRPVKLLTPLAGAGNHSPITASESGTIFLVPAHTGTAGTRNIALPTRANAVGCTYTFVMIDTAAQVFTVTSDGSERIVALRPKGDGDNTAMGSAGPYTSIGFLAAAVKGSSFSLTCVSVSDNVAWIAHDVIDGLALNVGSIAFNAA